MIARLVVCALVLCVAGCIDLEGAYAGCLDAGRCSEGSTDAGNSDGGGVDAGPVDGGADSGVPDSGTVDAGGIDSGTVDAGGIDAGGIDAGGIDAGGIDAGGTDAGGIDAGGIDAGGIDAGGIDAGGIDAGGPDAGGIDAGTPDAGLSCAGSPRKLLRCDPPIVIDGGPSGIHWGALAPYPQGFLVGFVRDIVEVHQVRFDAGVSFVFSRANPDGGAYTNAQLSLDTKGSEYLAVWLQGLNQDVLAKTSRDGTTNVIKPSTGGLVLIDAAFSADAGTIAVAGRRSSIGAPFEAAQSNGFPFPQLSATAFPANTFGVSVVWTNAGFRYVYSGGSITSGRVLVGPLNDAGYPGYFSSASRPDQNDAVASSGGDKVLVTWSDSSSVNVVGFGTNGTSGAAVQVSNRAAGWWTIGNCGTDCAVAGVVPYDGGLPVTLSFFNEDLTPISRGSWDLLCNVKGVTTERTTLSLATSGGRLGALVTTPSSVRLYVCDLPPGPL